MIRVVTQGGNEGVISWHQLQEPAQSADELFMKTPLGICLAVKMQAVSKDGAAYMQVIKPGELMTGTVAAIRFSAVVFIENGNCLYFSFKWDVVISLNFYERISIVDRCVRKHLKLA